jgi:hypothetical protein
MSNNDTELDVQQRYALTATENRALTSAVRNLALLINEHTLLLFAVCKHLGKTPEELCALISDTDFIDPKENRIQLS